MAQQQTELCGRGSNDVTMNATMYVYTYIRTCTIHCVLIPKSDAQLAIKLKSCTHKSEQVNNTTAGSCFRPLTSITACRETFKGQAR